MKGKSAVELECIANARPLDDLEITWLKDGIPIDQVGIAIYVNDLWNRKLSLLNLDFSHDGLYTCEVSPYYRSSIFWTSFLQYSPKGERTFVLLAA